MQETEIITPVPKKRRLRPWILSAVALLLAGTILAGCLTNWFGFYGPTTKLLLAGVKTLTASSFTANAILQVGKLERGMELQGQINTHQREITLVGRYTGETLIRFAIYEGFLIKRTGFGKYSSTDIHAGLEQFFDRMEENRAVDWETLLQAVSESFYEEYGQRLNYGEIDPALLSLFRLSNDPKWLKYTAGLTTQRNGDNTVYSFQPNTYEVIQDAAACFAPAFQNPADHAALTSGLSQEKLENSALSATWVVSQGYLTEVKVSAIRNDLPLSAGINFSKIGSTEIDFEELSDILARSS